MEAVFAGNAEQERLAHDRGITAPIITGARFYRAEDYHQKYYLRHDKTLMRELESLAPRDFVDSTIAARLNGYVAGHGSPARLREEIATFGLSPAGNAHLEQRVAQRTRA